MIKFNLMTLCITVRQVKYEIEKLLTLENYPRLCLVRGNAKPPKLPVPRVV